MLRILRVEIVYGLRDDFLLERILLFVLIFQIFEFLFDEILQLFGCHSIFPFRRRSD